MALVKGYKYVSEQEVKSDIERINKGEGLPKGETLNYTDYYSNTLDNSFYIICDKTIESYLGSPIEIIIPDFIIKNQ